MLCDSDSARNGASAPIHKRRLSLGMHLNLILLLTAISIFFLVSKVPLFIEFSAIQSNKSPKSSLIVPCNEPEIIDLVDDDDDDDLIYIPESTVKNELEGVLFI